MAKFEVNTGSSVIPVEARAMSVQDSFGALVFYDEAYGSSNVTQVFAPGAWVQAKMVKK